MSDQRGAFASRPTIRAFAKGLAIWLFVLTPLIWFFGNVQSQTSAGGHWNRTQLLLTNALALSLIVTGVLLLVYAGKRRLSPWIVSAALVVAIAVFVTWVLGWSHWCSGCGTP
jgi:hypothetical protein